MQSVVIIDPSKFDFSLCYYDTGHELCPRELSLQLLTLKNKNIDIYNFFYENQFNADGSFVHMYNEFIKRLNQTSSICMRCAGDRWVKWMTTVRNSFLPNFYYEYFTEYGTYLSKMREELKSYSEFLDNLEVKIHEWAKSKNINDMKTEKDLDESKLKIPQQEETSSCLVF